MNFRPMTWLFGQRFQQSHVKGPLLPGRWVCFPHIFCRCLKWILSQPNGASHVEISCHLHDPSSSSPTAFLFLPTFNLQVKFRVSCQVKWFAQGQKGIKQPRNDSSINPVLLWGWSFIWARRHLWFHIVFSSFMRSNPSDISQIIRTDSFKCYF